MSYQPATDIVGHVCSQVDRVASEHEPQDDQLHVTNFVVFLAGANEVCQDLQNSQNIEFLIEVQREEPKDQCRSLSRHIYAKRWSGCTLCALGTLVCQASKDGYISP